MCSRMCFIIGLMVRCGFGWGCGCGWGARLVNADGCILWVLGYCWVMGDKRIVNYFGCIVYDIKFSLIDSPHNTIL